MGRVADFERELRRKSKPRLARWYKVDLHNHTPMSDDYQNKDRSSSIDLISEQIQKSGLGIVMFTDHEQLPEQSFTEELQRRTGRLILRGVELNVFVDALDKTGNRVSKDFYYHLLVGFDPEGAYSPDYWLAHIYRECRKETRTVGQKEIVGLTASLDELADTLKDSNALIIPAHLHSSKSPEDTRSVDVIYSDRDFLKYAKHVFTALEVTSITTANFFDGNHEETEYLQKTCIRSSDSHKPEIIGSRCSYALMEDASYSELKAALGLPFRISLEPPSEPASYIIGMNICGTFFQDLWISFSPYCNVLIGIKGSGKTSVLESLRFAFGAEVPVSHASAVNSHLNAILGATGSVSVLIKRPDGAKMLVQRSIADKNFVVTFEDDRQEQFTEPESLLFPTYILGWHEIEQAATDINIRRTYMDTIAGRNQIRILEERAKALAGQIQDKHGVVAQRYTVYRDLDRQASRLQELRKSLQQLTEANLITLRNSYQSATDQREALNHSIDILKRAHPQAITHVNQLLPIQETQFVPLQSPLDEAIVKVRQLIAELKSNAEARGADIQQNIIATVSALEEQRTLVEESFQEFLIHYEEQLKTLSPEERRLLETHRDVLEQTKALAGIETEREHVRLEIVGLLEELVSLCNELANCLDERTSRRQEKVENLATKLLGAGVHLSIIKQQQSTEFQELSNRYGNGARAISELKAKLPDRLSHLVMRRAYGDLMSNLGYDYANLLFGSSEIGYFLGVFENDDIRIAFKVGKTGQEYSPIDQLSAGQRCTAIFPILLNLDYGSLIIDQPEDNLDNRHIAGAIAPALLENKRSRQMIFTSHNANLVVLSDAECITLFESDGSQGRCQEQGFFSTPTSKIANHVMEVLDGGEKALKLRALKYGLSRFH